MLLISVLEDEDYDVREEAARALGWTKDKRAVIPLIRLLNDKFPQVKQWASSSLGNIGDDRAVLPLVEALKNSASKTIASKKDQKGYWESEARKRMCEALGELEDNRAVEILREVLFDEGVPMRNYAVTALCRIAEAHKDHSSNPAADVLKEVTMNHKEQKIRERVKNCLPKNALIKEGSKNLSK